MERPSRCMLCKRAEETHNHLFLDCSFANEVWCSVLNELNFNITLPTNTKDFFACWKDYYQGSLFKKPDFSKAWMALPKYVCWKIWIARNKSLFENLNHPPIRVSFDAKALWTEALLSKGLRQLQLDPLNTTEKRWMKDLLAPINPTPKEAKKPTSSN